MLTKVNEVSAVGTVWRQGHVVEVVIGALNNCNKYYNINNKRAISDWIQYKVCLDSQPLATQKAYLCVQCM